jgi:nitrate/nitrite transport system substrate-binding protein
MTVLSDSVTASRRSRRAILKLTGAAATLAAARVLLPSGAFAQGAGPEVSGTKLGYIALTDASALIIAQEKGLFAKYGLTGMEIVKQAS